MAKAPTPASTALPWVPDHHDATRLYHGCLRRDATAILRGGVRHDLGRPDVDFGRGFYTTTLRRQAEDWAYLRHKERPLNVRGRPDDHPVVLWFRVPRESLARLDHLAFVRADYDAEDYWSLVQHCRGSIPASTGAATVVRDHARPASHGRGGWYDLASGPVAAFWQQRVAMQGCDQLSFHTPAAVRVLDDVLAGGRNADWGLIDVAF